MIRETRALTGAPFNVNLFCHRPAVADAARESAWIEHLSGLFKELKVEPPTSLFVGYRSFLESGDMLDILLRERPAVVSFHFGLPPTDWVRILREAGIYTLACVTDPGEARQAEAAGVDALVAQGVEAGGHRGVFDPARDRLIGTFALITLVRRVSRLPVIAAGGIMDGQGIAAALRLGASAVQMGTAFIACPESSADEAYREALRGDRARDTRISAAISGRPARGMVNRLFTDIGGPGAPDLPDYPITYSATKALVAAARNQANGDLAVQWAGQAAPLARALPAAELVAALREELEAALVFDASRHR